VLAEREATAGIHANPNVQERQASDVIQLKVAK
jgi:hypothetical protein